MTVFGDVFVGMPVSRNRLLFGQSQGYGRYPCLGCETDDITLDGHPAYGQSPHNSLIRPGFAWDGNYVWYTVDVGLGSSRRWELWREPFPSGTATVIRNPPIPAAGRNGGCESPTLDDVGNVWWIEDQELAPTGASSAGDVAYIRHCPKAGGTVTTVATITQALNQDTRVGGMVFNPYDGYIYYKLSYRALPTTDNIYYNGMVKMNVSGSTVASYWTSIGTLNDPTQTQLADWNPLIVDAVGTVWSRAGGAHGGVGVKTDGTVVYMSSSGPCGLAALSGANSQFVPWQLNPPNSEPSLGYDCAPISAVPVGGIIIQIATTGSYPGAEWVAQDGNRYRSPCNPNSVTFGLTMPVGWLPDHSKVLTASWNGTLPGDGSYVSPGRWIQLPCPAVG